MSTICLEKICGECNDYIWSSEPRLMPWGFDLVAKVVSSSACRDEFGLECAVCHADTSDSGWFDAGIVWDYLG